MIDEKSIEIYKQQSARFINLNDSLYRIPPLFASVIGALWYFAAQAMPTQRFMPAMVFLFAGMVASCGAVTVQRLRGYMTAYLNNLSRFEEPNAIPRSAGISTARAILSLMIGAGVLSVVGMAVSLLQRR